MKMGRKAIDPPVKQRCVRLSDAQVKLLRMWGRGDLSAGLRWLIETAAPMICKREEALSKGERVTHQ